MHPHFHKTRYLKIQGIARQVGGGLHRKSVHLPHIKLSGLWLGEHGFFAGNRIKVIVREDLLLIQAIKVDNGYKI